MAGLVEGSGIIVRSLKICGYGLMKWRRNRISAVRPLQAIASSSGWRRQKSSIRLGVSLARRMALSRLPGRRQEAKTSQSEIW